MAENQPPCTHMQAQHGAMHRNAASSRMLAQALPCTQRGVAHLGAHHKVGEAIAARRGANDNLLVLL
jgi:hypothetical protein